jgi:hypothetical protein
VNTLDTWGLQHFWLRAVVVVPAALAVSLSAAWLFHELIDVHFANASRTRAHATSRPLPALPALAT